MVHVVNSSAFKRSDDEPNVDEGVCKDGVDEATTILDLDATICYVNDFNVQYNSQELAVMRSSIRIVNCTSRNPWWRQCDIKPSNDEQHDQTVQ